MKLQIGDREFEVQPNGDTVTVGDKPYTIRVVRNANIVTVYVNEKAHAVQLPASLPEEGPVKLLVDAKEYEVELKGRAGARPAAKPKAKKSTGAGTGVVLSQMTGRVIRVDVKPGDAVKEGDVLLVVEAMKMENEIAAPVAGTVKDVSVTPGSRVAEGDPLLVIEPAAEAQHVCHPDRSKAHLVVIPTGAKRTSLSSRPERSAPRCHPDRSEAHLVVIPTGAKRSGGICVSDPEPDRANQSNTAMTEHDSLKRVAADIIASRKCPRLVEWRERVAREKRASFRDQEYWGKPVPPLGDPEARLLIVGLAPAAHGGNRTGRMFTGDRSGDWLYASLYRNGFANQPASTHVGDGLQLIDAYITAVVHCAPPDNKPTPEERDNCLPYLVRELRLLASVRVIACLGGYALNGVSRALGRRPFPKFGHGAEIPLPDGRTILCSFHPSQQNTFTGRLTDEMLDAVFARARKLVAG